MKRKIEPISADDIRQQVEKKYENRLGLIQHLAAYTIVNLILWALYLSSAGGFPWPLFVTAFWGIGMFSHIVDYYHQYGKGAEKRQAEIDAELERQLGRAAALEELQRRGLYDDDDEAEDAVVYDLDNVKRRGLRLSDDGELVGLEAWDDDEVAEKGSAR